VSGLQLSKSESEGCLIARLARRVGLENKLIEPGEEVGRKEGAVVCSERLGGILRYYSRRAA
jgi:hypothetical protein